MMRCSIRWHLAVYSVALHRVVHNLSGGRVGVRVSCAGIDSVRMRIMINIVIYISGVAALNVSCGLLDDSCVTLVGRKIVMVHVGIMWLVMIDRVAWLVVDNLLDTAGNCVRGVVDATVDLHPVVVSLRQHLSVSL